MSQTLQQKYRDIMPAGAGALFSIQLFSMISFSVFYSTLILYAIKGLHINDNLATGITGSFVALNYFLHLLGGNLAGRFFSYRSLCTIGMVLQATGCVIFSIPDTTCFFWGLAIFLSGSGLNSISINCMVTQLFSSEDKRRETAFLWNYSGMNIGFFVGFAISGYFHLHEAYRQLFMLSGIGNIIALVLIFYYWKVLYDRDTIFSASNQKQKIKKCLIGLSIIFSLIFILRSLLNQITFSHYLILTIGSSMFILLTILSIKQPDKIERNKMLAFIVLSISAFIFWILYQLAPMGLNLFIERNVERHVFGFIIAPQWVQNINTLIIIVGGPLLSIFFIRMRHHGYIISIPLQFALALLLIGVAYALLPLGIHNANAQGLTNFNWILLAYVLQSCAELFMGPVGYAMIGQLAPVRLRGFLMGFWMMLTGVAATMSDQFSKISLGTTHSLNPLITNVSFSHTFGMLGLSAILASAVLFILVPVIARLTQEKKMVTEPEKTSQAIGGLRPAG